MLSLGHDAWICGTLGGFDIDSVEDRGDIDKFDDEGEVNVWEELDAGEEALIDEELDEANHLLFPSQLGTNGERLDFEFEDTWTTESSALALAIVQNLISLSSPLLATEELAPDDSWSISDNLRFFQLRFSCVQKLYDCGPLPSVDTDRLMKGFVSTAGEWGLDLITGEREEFFMGMFWSKVDVAKVCLDEEAFEALESLLAVKGFVGLQYIFVKYFSSKVVSLGCSIFLFLLGKWSVANVLPMDSGAFFSVSGIWNFWRVSLLLIMLLLFMHFISLVEVLGRVLLLRSFAEMSDSLDRRFRSDDFRGFWSKMDWTLWMMDWEDPMLLLHDMGALLEVAGVFRSLGSLTGVSEAFNGDCFVAVAFSFTYILLLPDLFSLEYCDGNLFLLVFSLLTVWLKSDWAFIVWILAPDCFEHGTAGLFILLFLLMIRLLFSTLGIACETETDCEERLVQWLETNWPWFAWGLFWWQLFSMFLTSTRVSGSDLISSLT